MHAKKGGEETHKALAKAVYDKLPSRMQRFFRQNTAPTIEIISTTYDVLSDWKAVIERNLLTPNDFKYDERSDEDDKRIKTLKAVLSEGNG